MRKTRFTCVLLGFVDEPMDEGRRQGVRETFRQLATDRFLELVKAAVDSSRLGVRLLAWIDGEFHGFLLLSWIELRLDQSSIFG
jgi:hypothetical protein